MLICSRAGSRRSFRRSGFWKIGVRLPLLQGVTFTAVAPMISIGLAEGGGVPGLKAIYGAVIIGGIVAFFVAPFFSQLIRFFPPIVTGTVILCIGLVLLPVAAQEAGGGNPAAKDFGSIKNMVLAGVTLLIILAVYRMFRGFVATIAVLIGLVLGTVIGVIFNYTDFSGVGSAHWFGVTTPFHYGAPTFKAAAIISMIVVMLITAVETTGDVFATGEIVEKPIGKKDVARALRADGLATTLGGILNSFPYTCFAENVGLVRLTGVKSRWVVATAGLIMMIIGVIPKVGTVAVIGVATLRRVDFHDERNVVILAVSLGFALIPVGFPNFYHVLPTGVQTVVASGITMGSLSAILLNLVFNVWGGKNNLVSRVVPTPRERERLTIDQVNELSRGDFVENFGSIFQGPPWIAEQAYSARPFEDIYELRKAFHDVLFDAPADKQLELIRSYPDLAGVATREHRLSTRSVLDQAFAGLDHLTADEYMGFDDLNRAYRQKFGFPLIVAVRENTKETILRAGQARLNNSPIAEQATALVEIAKIANLRLLDLVEDPDAELAAEGVS